MKSNTIIVGQKLKVYPPESGGDVVYTVKDGDNLTKIAKKYNVTVDYIKKKNNLKSDILKAGQKLKL